MSITVRNITIGGMIPKIAVPIISRDREAILLDAELIAASDADIAEWRVDFFDGMTDAEKTAELAKEIKAILADKLLLFTCRTSAEGGEAEITKGDYKHLLETVAACESADLIDAELAAADSFLEGLIALAHSKEIAVVLSYHNFAKTPEGSVLLEKYSTMQRAGGDISKIAVMPNDESDVDRMIEVSRAASEKFDRPIIAIVMGEMGKCTRIACEAVGSCLTFGAIGGTSAPGQISADRLKKMLRCVHREISAFRSAENSKKLNEAIEIFCN